MIGSWELFRVRFADRAFGIARAALLVSWVLAASCAEDPDVLCDGSESCELSCPDGFCNFYCDGRAECVGSCEGGECTLVCTNDSACDLTCPTGDCALFCRDEASCACDGCRTSCDPSATCD